MILVQQRKMRIRKGDSENRRRADIILTLVGDELLFLYSTLLWDCGLWEIIAAFKMWIKILITTQNVSIALCS